MNTQAPKREKISTHLRTTVRFTEEEFDRLQHDAKVLGESIPNLLKRVYFKGPIPTPLMSKDDLKSFAGQLGRIGNNANQIARALNSGFREGFDPSIEDVQRQLTQLLSFLNTTYAMKRH